MSVVTANDIERANGVLAIGLKDVVTPLAADRAKELGVTIERVQKPPQSAMKSPPLAAPIAKQATTNSKSAVPNPPSSALSGALYRRGAPVPPALQLDRPSSSATADPRPCAAVVGAGHVGAMTALRLAETSLFSRGS
jgi:malate dehydrogenase